MNRSVLVLVLFAFICAFVAAPACADQFRLWVDDTGLGGIADKAKIGACLDNLKAHSVSGLWVHVESPEGAVNYKKAALSGLTTAAKFKTSQWAKDDFLSYLISEARSRGMKVIVVLHGSNSAAWDKYPAWRKRDSKGKEVLTGGKLKNFCPNSTYWEKLFFPMLREIAANYDVDGFCLDTSQVAYGTYDACFCPACKARFEEETGKKLPLRPVDRAKWANPTVKLHVMKRVEWAGKLFGRYAWEVENAKPGAIALMEVSGSHDSYKDAICARHAWRHAAYVTPRPVSTPRGYAVAQNQARKKAKQPLRAETDLAREKVVLGMDRYGYYEFLLKRALADGGGKPMMPIVQSWFMDPAAKPMGPLELEIAQIELAIASGAKEYCFSGPLASVLGMGKAAGTAWQNPKFIAYLKDLTAGERGKWVADMQPDSRVAILCDRDADFWAPDNARLVKSAGGLFAALHYWRKTPVSIISPTVPEDHARSDWRFRDTLAKYELVIAAGLDYVSKEDLQELREYVDKGGHLLIMGPIAGGAYEILGIATVGDPEPSGFVLPAERNPLFMVPEGFPGPMGSFRISDNKYDALSCKPRFTEGWEVLAHEVNDSGRRAAILMKETGAGNIGYLNSDMVGGFSVQMLRILANMAVMTAVRTTSIVPAGFSGTASINAFKSPDGLTRYIHIFTLDGESEVQFRIRPYKGMFPVQAEIIIGGGEPKPLQIVETNREPMPGEMTVLPLGTARLKLKGIKPPFAIVKIKCEKREQKPAEGQG